MEHNSVPRSWYVSVIMCLEIYPFYLKLSTGTVFIMVLYMKAFLGETVSQQNLHCEKDCGSCNVSVSSAVVSSELEMQLFFVLFHWIKAL